MDLQTFSTSRWVQWAAQPGMAEKVLSRIGPWLKKVGITKIIGLVDDLLAFLPCPEIALGYKTLVVAALLYLMSPLDLIPDFLPVLGWVDDIAVLTAVIPLLKQKLKEAQARCARQGRYCDSCSDWEEAARSEGSAAPQP